MVTFNDNIETRFDILTQGAESGLVSLMQKLGLIESRASRAAQQLRALGNSGPKGGVFGNVLTTDLAKKSMAELKGLPGSQAWANNYMEGINKAVSSISPDKVKLPTQEDLFKGLTESFSDGSISRMNKFANNLAMLESKGQDVSKAFKGVADIYGKDSAQMSNFEKAMSSARQEVKKMNLQSKQMQKLGPMFAFLFGGMALQRLGMGIVRFVLPAMDKLQGYTSEGTKKVNAMNASFQFLKFSMFEAVTSSKLFETFVEWVIKGANWMSKFVSNHPDVVAMAGAIGGIAATLGTLAIGVGLFNQFDMMAGYLGLGEGDSTNLIKGLSNLGSKLGVFAASNPALTTTVALLALASWALLDLMDSNENFSEIFKSNLSSVGDSLTGLVEDIFNLSGVSLDLNDSWKTLGLGFSWIISLGSLFQTAFISMARIGINSIDLITTSIIGLGKIMETVFTLDFDGFKKAMTDTGTNIMDSFNNLKLGVNEDVFSFGTIWESLGTGENSLYNSVFGEEDLIKSSISDLTSEFETMSMSASESMYNDLINGSIPELNDSFINVGNTVQTELIDKWENWTPSPKTFKIKVEKIGVGGPSIAGDLSSLNQYTGSVTGE